MWQFQPPHPNQVLSYQYEYQGEDLVGTSSQYDHYIHAHQISEVVVILI